MYKTALLLMVALTGSAFAQLNSIQFVNCFEKATNEVIQEIREEGGDTTRMCDSLSLGLKDRYIAKFSRVKNGEIVAFSAESMQQERVIDLYDFMKDEMTCFGDKAPKQGGSLVGALLNSKSYHRNLNLTERALNKIIGAEMWDSFFSPSAYNELGQFDTSYCQK